MTGRAWLVLSAVLFAAVLPARAVDLSLLAWDVRVVRYAATGDSSPIEGSDDTPAEEAAWLAAMATQLNRATNFFYEVGSGPDGATYTPIPLAASGTLASIQAELAKVTWIVRPAEDLPYSHFHDRVWHSYMTGGWGITYEAAVANQIANSGGDYLTGFWANQNPDGSWELVLGGDGSGVLSEAYRTCGYDEFDFCIETAGSANRGAWYAPSQTTVQPAPAAPENYPPTAKVRGYFLGRLGGEPRPGQRHTAYDFLWVMGVSMSSMAAPEPADCSDLTSKLSHHYVLEDGCCYARIFKPNPITCWTAGMFSSSSPLSAMSAAGRCAGGACRAVGGLSVSVDRADLSVRALLTPLWLTTPDGPRLDIAIEYAPAAAADGSDLGPRWTLSHGFRLEDYGSGGRLVRRGDDTSIIFLDDGDGTFSGPPGSGITLTADGGGGHTMTLARGERCVFDGGGKLTEIVDEHDRSLSFTYDGSGRVSAMTAEGGDTVAFTRDPMSGSITGAVESRSQRGASFAYNEHGLLAEVVDMGGRRTVFEYGGPPDGSEDLAGQGPLTAVVANVPGPPEQGGQRTEIEYAVSEIDSQREVMVTDPEGNTTTYRHDDRGTGVVTVIDPEGGMTSMLYESTGRGDILSERIDPLENQWLYDVDANGRVVTETDPDGNSTAFTYNAQGSVLTETRPGGAETTYTYAENGRDVLTRTDPEGSVTSYTYDVDGNVLTATRQPDAQTELTTTYTYDDNGRVLTETDPSGRTVTNTYDQEGRPTSRTVSGGGSTAYTYNARGLVDSETRPDGLMVIRTYDDLDRVIEETYIAPDPADNTTVTYTYDCCGVSQTVNRHGAITNYEYDSAGRRTAVIDHFGNRTEYEYDGNGNRTVVRDALGNETTTTYDLLGRPDLITYPDGTTESYTYDALGRQVSRTDRAGRTHLTTYDARGNVLTRQIQVPGDPDPVTVTLETSTYDDADRRTSSTDASGLTVTYAYDGLGRVLTETYPDTTTVTRTYGPAGALTQTDRLGNTTGYTYNANGQLESVTDALGNTTSFTYTATGKRATVTNALGQVTAFTYDQEGRLVATTYPDGSTQTRVYAADGVLSSSTDRTGITTSFVYDAMGRRLSTAVAGSTVQSVTYDALGRVAAQTDAAGVSVSMTYDSMGRVITRTMPDATAEHMTYGPSGILTRTDRGGAVTTYTYNAFGRRATETNPNSETLAFEYDAAGRMTRLTDSLGNDTQWTYDTEGRLVTKTYDDGTTYQYTYDAAGRLLTRTDAKDLTTSYTYDAAGRLLTVDYPGDPDITYTYDALGRKLTVTDAAGTTAFTYHAETGRTASVDGPFDNDTVTCTWDAAGRRAATALDGDAVASYTYDAQGRMASVAAPGTVFTYTYDGASTRITSLAMPGGFSVTRTYDALGRLDVVTNSSAADTVSMFDYTVDNHDRRTRVDLVDGGRWEYTYDAAGQLTGGIRYAPKLDQQEGTLVQYGYQYDAMGNPTQRTEDAGVSTYTYNELNQLVTGDWSGTLSAFGWTRTQDLDALTVDGQAATVFERGPWTAKGLSVPAGETTLTVTRTATDQTQTQAQTAVTRPADQTAFSHDANGNMLGHAGWTYTWNDENRLIAVEKPGETRITYTYDFQGRRRTRKVYAWATDHWSLVTEHAFIWDGWLLLAERITDQATGDVMTRTFICGLDLSGQLGGEGTDAMSTAGGIGGILAVTTSTDAGIGTAGTVLLCYDGNGNVVNLVDPVTAATAATYEYSPFGKVLVASGPLATTNPIRFSTKYAENAAQPTQPAGPELCYYGYRYYRPDTGRWLSRDPIGEGGGVNIHGFVGNSPLGSVDPTGLLIWTSYTCGAGFDCLHVNSVDSAYQETGWGNCDRVEDLLMWGTIAGVSASVFKSHLAAIIAGALSGTFCECQVNLRYREYEFQKWYGDVKAGWSLIQGPVYNYKLDHVDPPETGAFDVQRKVRWRLNGGGGWTYASFWWESVGLGPTSLVPSSPTEFPTVGLTPGVWSGWMTASP